MVLMPSPEVKTPFGRIGLVRHVTGTANCQERTLILVKFEGALSDHYIIHTRHLSHLSPSRPAN